MMKDVAGELCFGPCRYCVRSSTGVWPASLSRTNRPLLSGLAAPVLPPRLDSSTGGSCLV